MGLKYGNESQFTAFSPDCGLFAQYPGIHYVIVAYTPVVQTFAIILNSWIASILAGGGESNKLLQQSQHVYVLGTSITNVVCSIGIMGFWLDYFVLPCIHKPRLLCGFQNLVQTSGGYQIVLNVCLVCYDRFRLVTRATLYDHNVEVKRAKRRLVATSVVSGLLFLVPEIGTSLLVGENAPPGAATVCWLAQQQVRIMKWIFSLRLLLLNALAGSCFLCTVIAREQIFSFCLLYQQTTQPLAILFGHSLANVIGVIMVVGPFAFILTFTLLTAYKLFKGQRKAAAAGITSQMADSRKLIRSSLIMFGMVGALLITWGPFTIAMVMLEAGSQAINFTAFFALIVLLDTAPALDPLAFALTLPKLRKRARETTLVRMIIRGLAMLNVKFTNRVGDAAGTTGGASTASSVPANAQPQPKNQVEMASTVRTAVQAQQD